MHDEHIKNILDDLYKADPSLKEHEALLVEIVRDLMVMKPDVAVDASFRKHLKETLQERIAVSPARGRLASILHLLGKSGYAIGGAVLTMVVLLVFLQTSKTSPTDTPLLEQALFSPTVTVSRSSDANLFGPLVAGGEDSNTTRTSDAASGVMGVMGMGSSGSNAPVATETPDMVGAESKAMGMGMPSIYPYPYETYTYTYVGDPITDLDETVFVLKRIKTGGATGATQFFKNFDLGLFDLSTFSDLSLQNVSIKSGDNYYITVDAIEESVSIMGNISMPVPLRATGACSSDGTCSSMIAPEGGLKPSEVPTESATIAAVNAFLSAHGISTAPYGAPEIEYGWKLQYARAKSGKEAYLSESIPVVYPLLIEGSYVYDSGYGKNGMTVNVDARTKTVTGVWNILTQTYQSSSYAAETDPDVLIRYAEKGGYSNPWIYMDIAETSGRARTIRLLTPTRGYLKIWNYNATNGMSDELLIPALIFPIEESSQDIVSSQNVIVPLAKDLLTRSIEASSSKRFVEPGSPGIE